MDASSQAVHALVARMCRVPGVAVLPAGRAPLYCGCVSEAVSTWQVQLAAVSTARRRLGELPTRE